MGKCEHCGREANRLRRGLCPKHYNQILKYGEFLDNNPRTRYDENEIIKYDDYAEIVIYNHHCEEIARALIDLDDINKIKKYKWSLKGNGYIAAGDNGVMLHKIITNTNKNEIVDHINGNKLDNRKSNLRICTYTQNNINKCIQSNNKSGYPGVRWDERAKKWKVRITVNKKQLYLGYFINKEDVIKVRKQAEIKYFGEYRRKNLE